MWSNATGRYLKSNINFMSLNEYLEYNNVIQWSCDMGRMNYEMGLYKLEERVLDNTSKCDQIAYEHFQ